MEKEEERFDQTLADGGSIPCAVIWDAAMDGCLFPNSKVRCPRFWITFLKGHTFLKCIYSSHTSDISTLGVNFIYNKKHNNKK